jgi:two-component system sensor histidine kinase KdpD
MGLVALLQDIAPVTGLGVVYLPAVMFVAIRRGSGAGFAAAVLSVLTLNFFFIEPRYTLTIAESQNVVALTVFLIVALVVGRLAGDARQRATEAEDRARLAAAREREAKMLAEAASSVLASADIEAQLQSLCTSVEASTDGKLRIQLASAPSGGPDETSVPLRLKQRTVWLHAADRAAWTREDLDRIAEPLARLIDVALEQEQVRQRSAEAEAARQADVAKTALLHAISHDLRTPLTAITTAASALRDGGLSATDREELVSVMNDELSRLSRLVDDLLDLSRVEAAAVNPRLDWCDLRELVARGAAHAQTLHGEHPIELALPDDLPLVRADASQLERVFSNLIDNAMKFSSPAEAVRVSASTRGDRVTVRVTNRGRGIPLSKRGQVFEPFVRAGGRSQGSGLGLAICRGFVEANGGSIVLQSADKGETSFAVSFPVAPHPATAK